jgi:TPR repeat protein
VKPPGKVAAAWRSPLCSGAEQVSKLVLLFLAAVITAAMGHAAVAGPFEDGLDAFNSGHFARAFAIWWPSAVNGDAKSQASVGFMYYAGKGVHRDDRRSLFWFRLAADAGQPTAQFFLGLQYLYGLGVPRDPARAYAWCDIALTNGYPDSLSCRDAADLEMSAADKRRSTQLTEKFFRTHDFRN